MGKVTGKLYVRVAWWFRVYYFGLLTFCAITRLQPDYQRVEYWTRRAIKVETHIQG